MDLQALKANKQVTQAWHAILGKEPTKEYDERGGHNAYCRPAEKGRLHVCNIYVHYDLANSLFFWMGIL